MADFVSILSHLNESITPVEKLITGGAYVTGMFFIFKALYHLREFGNQRAAYGVQTSGYPSMVWLFGGLCFLYLPTALGVFTASVFGYDSPLAYSTLTEYLIAQYGSVTSVMIRLVQIAGVLWFILGIIMITRSASPKHQGGGEAGQGFAYIFGGILAFNIQATTNMLTATAQMLASGSYSLGLASFFTGG